MHKWKKRQIINLVIVKLEACDVMHFATLLQTDEARLLKQIVLGIGTENQLCHKCMERFLLTCAT